MYLDICKNCACALLDTEVHDLGFYGFVSHPFISYSLCPTEDMKFVDIFESKENLDMIKKRIRKDIMRANSLSYIFMLLNKSYRLLYLDIIFHALPPTERSKWLSEIWVESENPNMDVNVSLEESVSLFRDDDILLDVLMEEEELEYYNSLPDEFEVYRGVAVGRIDGGLSWTDKKEVAEWFAHRFDTENEKGYVRKMKIKKEDVLAYFNRRGEDELVIDIFKYK